MDAKRLIWSENLITNEMIDLIDLKNSIILMNCVYELFLQNKHTLYLQPTV